MKKAMKNQLKSKWSLKEPLFVEKTDKRYKHHLKQLRDNGFSDSETWGAYSNDCRVYFTEAKEV